MISKKLIKQFNSKDTLIILSSFPKRDGALLTRKGGLTRYSYLLTKNFPKYRKIVVMCEKDYKNDKPYFIAPNILAIPSYKFNSKKFALDVIKNLFNFNKAKSFHIQFEFSLFGGKVIIPQIILLTTLLYSANKYVSIMLHQVTLDLNELSSHLGLKSKGLRIFLFNKLLNIFYRLIGATTHKVLVHDWELKEKLASVINENKIEIIPHGVSEFIGRKRKDIKLTGEYKIKKNEFVIGVFGYRSSYKGTDWICENFSKFINDNPKKKIKLLLIGGDAPTLKGTSAYLVFTKKLNSILENNKKNIIATGFLPEEKVAKAFSLIDLVVFPYRARMSASGAFSVALQNGVSFMGSKPFSINFMEPDVKESLKKNNIKTNDIVFRLDYNDFSNKLKSFLRNKNYAKRFEKVGEEVTKNRQWKKTSFMYEQNIIPLETLINTKFELVEA